MTDMVSAADYDGMLRKWRECKPFETDWATMERIMIEEPSVVFGSAITKPRDAGRVAYHQSGKLSIVDWVD